MTWRDLSRRVDRLEPERAGNAEAWADRFSREQSVGDREDPGSAGVFVAFTENEDYRIEFHAAPDDVPDWIDIDADLPVSLD
jgi:hypothetical protein